ncbi:MAG TPA: hypothetical protein VGV86_09450 [Acidimicrobiales bacterium]|nr:hypothetical protein [Acidimicrobiales bacterium]
MARVGRRTAATLLASACLVCSPAVLTTTRAELDFVSTPAAAVPVLQSPAVAVPTVLTPLVVPTGPSQWFLPSGSNQGTEGLAMFLANLALRDNAPLYVSETTRATGGSNSDHHVSRTDSWAVDVAVRGIQQPTAATRTAAARIASALGEPNWTGGDLTKTVNGYRFQVLWLVAGHFNHVHVGVRKL